MAYTVLARRYRSQEFDEVVGQEPIARTLQRAIESNRVAHAYLFCGTRGVGKTSMARIFAKSLNVTDEQTDKQSIAAAIMQGDDIDVIEIDGASNNSVEQARDLIANSIYRPARSPYKIYIIDEVHMLSNAAFNALLKTMEEPPSHVKFILCTTEPQKVPQTIQSRCQRFDFRAISTAKIAEHIREILAQEKIKADESVVQQVARLGAGSMRDALSLLDRLMASGEGKLTADLLEQMLGLPDTSLIAQLAGAIGASDVGGALRASRELLDRGVSIEQIVESLIDRLRTLMIISACGRTDGILDLSPEEANEAAEQAQQFDTAALVHAIMLLENLQRNMKFSSTGRALFDAAIVRLAQSEKFIDAAALLRGSAGAGNGTGGGDGGASRAQRSAPPSPRQLSSAATEKKKLVDNGAAAAPGRPYIAEIDRGSADPTTNAAVTASRDVNRGAEPEAGNQWAVFCEAIEQAMPALHSMLEHARLGRISQTEVTIIADDPAVAKGIETRREGLGRIIGESLGRRIEVVVTVSGDDVTAHDSGGHSRGRRTGATPTAHPAIESKLKEEAAKIPIVRQAMDVLDARIISVEESAPPPRR